MSEVIDTDIKPHDVIAVTGKDLNRRNIRLSLLVANCSETFAYGSPHIAKVEEEGVIQPLAELQQSAARIALGHFPLIEYAPLTTSLFPEDIEDYERLLWSRYSFSALHGVEVLRCQSAE